MMFLYKEVIERHHDELVNVNFLQFVFSLDLNHDPLLQQSVFTVFLYSYLFLF